MKAAFGKKRRGEGRATADMEELFRQYGAMVQGYLTRLSGNVELARELTQETFYQAEKHIERFDGKSGVSTWLCGIARHLYLNALRRARRETPLAEELLAPGDVVDELCRRDRAMVAHRLLHQLAEPYREVFTLRTFCELTHEQIGELFGKSAAWSRVAYYRARQMLREAMEENADEREEK